MGEMLPHEAFQQFLDIFCSFFAPLESQDHIFCYCVRLVEPNKGQRAQGDRIAENDGILRY